MLIMNGQVSDGYGNWYQIHNLDGSLASGNYQGVGQWVRLDNGSSRVVLGNAATSCNLPEYRVGEIDQVALRKLNGYCHAVAQKRCVASAKWHPDFLDGWRDGWSDKRSGNVCEEFILGLAKVTIFYASR